ncbi:hypothetical protein BO221_35455 [Archangium sp. Cb G35]|uniref:hypothetical protein n=1 Tax=Archangium sp. Cb G35 TaxID=1920190 RepID=UPI000937A351|nr:hypothetical protein [Archangium sp. Cb G35]OJT19660.1 hypothetical protein BO221_35455 [Archangium sp. Cb G35]
MHDSGFKRWMVLGVLASASWLVSACGSLPQQGTYEVAPGFARSPAQSGYNGTIQDIPTSIDPRTPEAQGTQGRSLLLDPGERALLETQGGAVGGSGSTPPAQGPEGGPLYEELGTEGSVIAPSRELPASQGNVGNDRPTDPNTPPARRDSRGK